MPAVKINEFLSHIYGHTYCHQNLKDSSVVIDLGANRGEFSSSLQAAHQSSCHLVEANPDLYKLLQAGPKTFVHHLAIGGHDGVATFNISKHDESSSLLELSKDYSPVLAIFSKSIEVPVQTLASFMRSQELEGIDLLKIDIEGAETQVLLSLSNGDLERIAQITVEFHDAPRFQFDLSAQVVAVLRRLKKCGFLVLKFSRPENTDILCLNKKALGISWVAGAWLRWRHDYMPYMMKVPHMIIRDRVKPMYRRMRGLFSLLLKKVT